MGSPALEVVTIVHAHAVTGQRRGQDTERWHEPSCRCSTQPDVTGGYTRQSSRATPRTRDKQRHHESQEFQRPQVLEVRVLEHVCHIWSRRGQSQALPPCCGRRTCGIGNRPKDHKKDDTCDKIEQRCTTQVRRVLDAAPTVRAGAGRTRIAVGKQQF